MDYVVYVDSNNRDGTLFPNSNSYTLYLSTPIHNISKVEVLSAMLPNVYSSQYLTLDIVELRSTQTLVASALTKSSASNALVTNSNAYSGAFAFVPIKAATALASNTSTFSNTSFIYNNEFYSQNYKIETEYPSRIDSIDRLTIAWRNAGTGSPFYDSSLGRDLGRNMFILRFCTIPVPETPDRPISLPEPVPWSEMTADKTKIYVIAAFVAMALCIIIFGRRENNISP